MTTHLIIPDQHAHPDFHNDRADWIGKLIADLKPDVVMNMGDAADLASLSAYDKGKASFQGRNYQADIESHLDFQERMWAPMWKLRKKLPRRIVLEGNHEHRITRALDIDPQLKGNNYGLSFDDLDFDRYYQDVVRYNSSTPGIITVDGVSYSHYFISGVMARPIGGVNHASSLINKNFVSSTCSHSHLVDWAVRSNSQGKQMMGLVAGCYQDYDSPWAGGSNELWWSGVVVKRGVEDGVYSPEFISIDQLRKAYS
tara:strand:- start:352 stop:1119 length:768 start_codon:yes stop_codon:yes gene_type:complete